jgi:formate dehydrogenase assembly factor FdhD
MIKSIAECGANVIITSSKFSEMAMHYCERYSIMMLKVRAGDDLRLSTGLIGRVCADCVEV